MIRPIVKWAGGKRQLIPELLKRSPESWGTYFEPFIGGAAFLLALYNSERIHHAIMSDANRELINLYETIQTRPDELIETLADENFKNEKEFFYENRIRYNKIINTSQEPVLRAAYFIYMNRHCFNGLWRVNKSGTFNVPFGSYKNPSLPDRARIQNFSDALQQVEILNTDFAETVKKAKEGDFVYFDPPYMPASDTAKFTSYNASGFSFEEQKRLAEVFADLADRGVSAMLSNANVPAVHELYQDFTISVVAANRMINRDATKRTGSSEVIVTNYQPDTMQKEKKKYIQSIL